ncbi:MAG: FxsA family protein [Planctomycetaceae bacterium]
MLGRIILAFILVPLIELVLLSQLYDRTNLLTTLAVVIGTGFVGAQLARRQGLKVWRTIQLQVAAGKAPSREILDGVMILVAGAFLLTPGILTDCVGFLLLIPQTRRIVARRLTRWFQDNTVGKFRAATWTSVEQPPGKPPSFNNEVPSVRVVDPNSGRLQTTPEQDS